MGQYFTFFPTVSQDVLRNLIQGFASEAEEVKLQILNFAAKLFAAKIENENTERTHGLIQYLFSLASFDQSYTVRQKTRLLKSLIFPEPSEKTEATEATRSKILSLFLSHNLNLNGPGMVQDLSEIRAKEVAKGKYHLHTVSFLVKSSNKEIERNCSEECYFSAK
jgi:vesicle coat complex subunit